MGEMRAFVLLLAATLTLSSEVSPAEETGDRERPRASCPRLVSGPGPGHLRSPGGGSTAPAAQPRKPAV